MAEYRIVCKMKSISLIDSECDRSVSAVILAFRGSTNLEQVLVEGVQSLQTDIISPQYPDAKAYHYFANAVEQLQQSLLDFASTSLVTHAVLCAICWSSAGSIARGGPCILMLH